MQPKRRNYSGLIRVGLLVILVFSIWACQARIVLPEPVAELVLRTWEGDMPEDLFNDFTQKTGISVRIDSYEAQEDAIADIEAGKPADVVVMDSRFIPGLIEKKHLKKIDRSYVPNFRYISAGFRGLTFDPNNQYSIPYQWGTAGIVYRRDLAGREISKWSDLWDPAYRGKVSLWRGQPREVIGLTLKMLGFSANSEKPEELAATMDKLRELQPDLIWTETIDPYTSVPGLMDGRVIVALGYAYDAIEGKNENPNIYFSLPAEGAVLWGEHFVIPSTSRHSVEAEKLLNYLLEPEVMAKIANYNFYAVAHDGAWPLIKAEIRNDPLIYPPDDLLVNTEIIFQISEEAEQRIKVAWEQFIAASPEDAP